MKTPFAKYPFPGWIFASKDELCCRLSSALCTPLVRGFLWFHRCRVGRCFTTDGLPRIRMQRPGSIGIGSHVTLNCRVMSNLAGICQPTILQAIEDGFISIGENTGLSGSILSSRQRISVGRRCNIGVNVRIYDHDFHSLHHLHRTERGTDRKNTKSAPVDIGDDVLVGANAIILKGVTIGSRSIVGAGSVLTKRSYPSDSLIGGNPARLIRHLTP
jgi:acetyltransferase-like isoleucine patch superfamily enzyme